MAVLARASALVTGEANFEKKNSPKFYPGGILNLAVLIFPCRYQPSIVSVVVFTSVFGMGTGVTPQLLPPENFIFVMR